MSAVATSSAFAHGGENAGKESDAVKCCVCLDEVDYHGTVMVHCGKCAMDVHVKCYGMTVPTDGSTWYCEACQYVLGKLPEPTGGASTAPRMQPRCAICPIEGGALRRTSQPGVWSHVLCVNWIPELSHSLTGEMNEVVNIAVLDRSRETLRCLVCGQRGGCIQCISGRCARAFHVVCAIRSPSSLIFTGYNGENQQIYHCKTHLSDVRTKKFEMIDNSWRTLPLVRDFLQANPPVDEKCRVCQNKIVAANQQMHETQCLLSWLTREEMKKRKEEMERRGLKPIEISYSSRLKMQTNGGGNARANGDSASKATDRHSRTDSGNKKRQHIGMRPCPDCGESIRETLMVSHLKNRCSRGKAANNNDRRAKNPNTTKRKNNGPPQRALVDLTQEEATIASDLSDVLFASWPGQNAGSHMDSTHLWKVVNNNFYSSKALIKRRMEQLCKSLCGAKLEDIGNFTRKMARHDLLDCVDTVLLERVPDDPTEALHLKAILHRCDFMMRASRTRCLEDIYAHPSIQISHFPRAPVPPSANGDQTGSEDAVTSQIRVVFANNENAAMDCKYVMQLSKSGSAVQRPPADGSFWSSFQHDALSTLAGPAVEANKVPIGKDDNLWVSMEAGDDADLSGIPRSLLQMGAQLGAQDELTPEISLLMENLKEQMKQNRFRLRSLSKKLQLTDHYEGQSQRAASVTEGYYLEFAAWKRLCKSLFVGYKDIRDGEAVIPEAEMRPRDSGSSSSSPSRDEEDAEDAIDDGTCVVCFDGLSPETNPIVFCDRCDLAVHQGCYGIVKLPSNEFYCDRCSIEDDGEDPSSSVFCQLCSLRDGAFKRTVDGKWVHVVCALWCPKVWIGNLQNLSDISLVAGANQTRFLDTTAEVAARVALPKADNQKCADACAVPALEQGSLCMHCKVACGRTIQCSHAGCKSSFHPLCGWFEGLPMTIKLGERGFLYSGGGAGLQFQMLCSSHLPEHYPNAERLVQRRRRRKFRIDSFYITQCKVDRAAAARPGKPESSLLSGPIMQALISADGKSPPNDSDVSESFEWTDKAVCGACFEYCSPIVGDELDVDKLRKRQFLMRCQYCSTFIHPECCISETGQPSEIFQSNWICERCTLVGEKTATPCMMCDKSSEYLMPCTNPTVIPSAANQQQQQVNPTVQTLPALFLNVSDQQLPAVVQQQSSAVQQPPSQYNRALPQQQVTTTTGTSQYDKWVHVFCSKWMKTKTVRKNRILCAHTPNVNTDGIAVRCELCLKRGRNMVNCAQCHKRFHPICAVKKKLFVAKSSRQDWRFYCELHTPVGAVFDEERQSWMTTEILGQLQDLRQSLERGRMLLEMSRQRDRQQKRLLNLCKLPFMEASIEIILKKRPTPAMREAYQSITDDILTDTPKRLKPTPPSPKRTPPPSRSRARGQQANETSAEQSATPSRKRSRVAAEASGSPATGTRKRFRLDLEPESPSSESGSVGAAGSRRSSARRKLDGSESRNRSTRTRGWLPSELKTRFEDCLDRATEPSDFDGVVEQNYPELYAELKQRQHASVKVCIVRPDMAELHEVPASEHVVHAHWMRQPASGESQCASFTTRTALSTAGSTSDTINSNEEVHYYEEWELDSEMGDDRDRGSKDDDAQECSTDSHSQSPRCSTGLSETQCALFSADDGCDESKPGNQVDSCEETDDKRTAGDNEIDSARSEASTPEADASSSTNGHETMVELEDESRFLASRGGDPSDASGEEKSTTSRSSDLPYGNDSIAQHELSSSNTSRSASFCENPPEQDSRAVLKNIQVFVRVRPLSSRNGDAREETSVVNLGEECNSIRVVSSSNNQGNNCIVTDCGFDKVFMNTSTQEDVFRAVEPSIQASLQGYNATIFAYGQTGTGKTHTIFGEDEDVIMPTEERQEPEQLLRLARPTWGIIPRAVAFLLDQVEDLKKQGVCADVQCSFMQIYNDRLFDLLTDRRRQRPLILREQPTLEGGTNVVLQGLSSERISTLDDALHVLRRGRTNRSVRETEANSCSSRSHAIVQINISTERKSENGDKLIRRSRLNMVDLAGSEKWNTELEMEDAHSQELKNINASLSALGNCIAALSEAGRKHIPYRDSTLTRLLQDSFGGNTQACLIATISPSQRACEETIRTLQFADRARSVMQSVRVNETVSGASELQVAKAQIAKLRERLESEQRRRHQTRIKEQEAAQKEFLEKLQVKEKEIQKLSKDNAVYSRWREEDIKKIRDLETRIKELEVQTLGREGADGVSASDRPEATASDGGASSKHDLKQNVRASNSTTPSLPAALKAVHSRKTLLPSGPPVRKEENIGQKPYKKILERYALGSKKGNRKPQDSQANLAPQATSTDLQKRQDMQQQVGVISTTREERQLWGSDANPENTRPELPEIFPATERNSELFYGSAGLKQYAASLASSNSSGLWKSQAIDSTGYPSSSDTQKLIAIPQTLPYWGSQSQLSQSSPPNVQASSSLVQPSARVGPTALKEMEPELQNQWKALSSGSYLPTVADPAKDLGMPSKPSVYSSLSSPSLSASNSDVCGKHSLKGCVLCAVKDPRPPFLSSKPSAASATKSSIESSVIAIERSDRPKIADTVREGPCDRHQLASCFICGSSSGGIAPPPLLSQSTFPAISYVNSSTRGEESKNTDTVERNPLLMNDAKCAAHSLANCVLCAGVKAMTRKIQQGSPTKKAFLAEDVSSNSAGWASNQSMHLEARYREATALLDSSFDQIADQQQTASSSGSKPPHAPGRRHTIDHRVFDTDSGIESPSKFGAPLRPQLSSFDLHSKSSELSASIAHLSAPHEQNVQAGPAGSAQPPASSLSSSSFQSRDICNPMSPVKASWQPATRPSIKELAVDGTNRKNYQAMIREASDAAAFVLRRKG